MRRTAATLLITALLSSYGPLMFRDRGGDWDPIRTIVKIVRHLLPSLMDGGDTIGPPKP